MSHKYMVFPLPRDFSSSKSLRNRDVGIDVLGSPKSAVDFQNCDNRDETYRNQIKQITPQIRFRSKTLGARKRLKKRMTNHMILENMIKGFVKI